MSAISDLKPARAVILHDCNRYFYTGDFTDAESICGTYGQSPWLFLDNTSLLALLDALDIPYQSYPRQRFIPKDQRYVVEKYSLQHEELPILQRRYDSTECLRLSAAENGRGLIRIQATYRLDNVNGEPDQWVEQISHFGAYSVIWQPPTFSATAKKGGAL